MYYALVQSHLIYGILSWDSVCKSAIKPFCVIVNRIAVGPQEPHVKGMVVTMLSQSPLYQKLQILQILQFYSIELLKFMFSYQRNLLTAHSNTYFDKVKAMHTHGTRMASQSKLFIPRHNTVTAQKSYLIYSGAVMWNSLPKQITVTQSHHFTKG